MMNAAILPSSPVPVSAATWHGTLGRPVMTFPVAGRFDASVSVYSGTAPDMAPPPLSDNILVMHLGGPERVRRAHSGVSSLHEVAPGGLTVMPAMEQDRWSTSGPIEFAHLVLSTALVAQVATEEFDTDVRELMLVQQVGTRVPVVEQAFRALIDTASAGDECGRLYPESLLIVLLLALLRDQSRVTGAKRGQSGMSVAPLLYKGGLAGWQLRRVMDYMAENFAQDIELLDLIDLVGLSRAQFFRSFKQSTGLTPHAALTRFRLDQARSLFERTDLPVDDIATAVGLGRTRFPALFKQHVGVSPRMYRNSLR